MHIDRARKISGIIAAFGFANQFINLVNYGPTYGDSWITFLYAGTIIAMITMAAVMLACFLPDHHRNNAFKHGMVLGVGLVIATVLLAIPSF